MILMRLISAGIILLVVGRPVSAATDQQAPSSRFGQTATEQAEEHADRGFKLASSGDLDKAAREFRTAVTQAPKNAHYVYGLGVVLAGQGKLQSAADAFRQALKLDPSSVEIRQSLAAAEWQLGRLPDAEKNLRVILRQAPNEENASFLLGMVLENRGQYAEASKLLASAPDQLNAHPESIAALLHCYYKTSKRAEARAMEESLLKKPSQIQAIFLGAQVAIQGADYPAAERMLSAIHDSYPSRREVDYALARLKYSAGNYSEAQALLQRVIAGGEESKYFNLLAWCLARSGQTADAVKSFDRAIDLDPGNVSNYVDLATVLMNAGLFPPALQAANKAVEVGPQSEAAHRARAQIQVKQHDYAEAVDSYAKAVQLDSTQPELLVDLAEAEAAAGQFDRASALFEKLIAQRPREAQLYYQYAKILLHHGQDPTSQSKATLLLEKSLGIDSSMSDAHYELGNICLNHDRPAEALEQLRTAEKLNPNDADTRYALSLALRKLGQLQEADDELQTFKKLKAQHDDFHR